MKKVIWKKKESQKAANKLMRTRHMIKLVRLYYRVLCSDCREIATQAVNLDEPGESNIQLEMLCPDCQEKARPILEKLQAKVNEKK